MGVSERLQREDTALGPCKHLLPWLESEMSPKAHVLKAWFPAWYYWEVLEPLWGKVQCICVVRGGVEAARGIEASSFLFRFLATWWSFLHTCSHHDVLPCHWPWVTDQGPETETVSQNKPFFPLSWLSRIFVPMLGRLLIHLFFPLSFSRFNF